MDPLSPVDRALFYRFGFGPKRPIPIPIVHHSFEHYARTQPHAIAVEDPALSTITYHDLDLKANRLAHRLRAAGIIPGKRVCILAKRNIPFVVAIVAVLKSGGQYVPLDAVTITDDTLQFVLEDSNPTVVLTVQEFSHRVPSAVVLEEVIDEDEKSNANSSKVEDLTSPEDGAYCIYTSGTTGRPKGVDVKHIGAANVISGPPANIGMAPGLRVAQLLNIAFDMGAWEILGSLYNGCTLCLRGNSSAAWASLLKTVDIVISTPSILTRHHPSSYPNIKAVIVGGEPCPQSLADTWAEYTDFHNCCGPTEISICNTVQKHTVGYPLSIGKPIPNTNVYILHPETCQPMPVGEAGCMWVGGIGANLTSYLNLPERTSERWREDPFVDADGARMFNTGDLGRWRKDGQLDHMGRVDDQVKVKGFRVELDGVGTAMRRHPPVTNALALLLPPGDLWGFVTPSTVSIPAVEAATKEIQPYYAVPTKWLALDDFPMTKNGKVDKRALGALVLPLPTDAPSVSPADMTTPTRSSSLETEGSAESGSGSEDSSDVLATPRGDCDEPEYMFEVPPEGTEGMDPEALSLPSLEEKLGSTSSLQGDVFKKLRIAWAA
ncbi:hypothetical protein E1B28_012552 [Marasmius oreades]|uniref:AMP-dependent synthetase/ligase domain-containing protein n=1 Tax=Marasmius oreades TaxID=181124 RepID=A0A9P7RT36_9AGAR|nr:uncharacterized protein E1B28_012552 [Marasmius oreades]KAG7088573.1 hypothetical protein E1B28_012552 [Marasmius oreades]